MDQSTLSNPPPPGVAYFNNAGMTSLPPAVAEAGRRALEYKIPPWKSPPHDTAEDEAEIRRLFSTIIGAAGDGLDVAITPSTAFAITLAAHNLHRTGKIRPNSKVLLIQDQMTSAVYPWQEMCHRVNGLELEIVPYPESEDMGWTELIIQRIEDATHDISVACLPECHWSDGSLLDLVKISKLCKANNVAFVVDATQSIGAMSFSVKDVDAELVAASVHKWLLAPHGCSLVYVPSRNQSTWLPLDQHDRSRLGQESPMWDGRVNKLHGGKVEDGAGYSEKFVSGARRLDSGGRPNPILVPMIRAALKIVAGYDIETVQTKLSAMNELVLDGAKKMGFTTTIGPRAGHILGLRPGTPELKAKLTPEEMINICKRLQSKNIFIAVRSGAFRISPYLDTTDELVRLLLVGLAEECGIDAEILAEFVDSETHEMRYCSVM